MAHEIEVTDSVGFAGQGAWHGLGQVWPDAPTPREALERLGLDWEVEQWWLSAHRDEHEDPLGQRVPDVVANVRADISEVLGIVSKGYHVIQNAELAEFCELLAEQNDTVHIESAGSIRSGKKVWFLIQGRSFSVRTAKSEDGICPYILVSNGHDGGTAIRCTPTTIRVVCSNTMHAVIPDREHETGRLKRLTPQAFVACHVGDVRKRVADAKAALGLYGRAIDETRSLMNCLASTSVDTAAVELFFLSAYSKMRGPVPSGGKTEEDNAKRERAAKFIGKCLSNMEIESSLFGGSAWTMLNAFTETVQNQARTSEAKAARCLLGSYDLHCRNAFELALQTVA